ncbi:MAG TPA: NUDIX domain-containing protein [Candidatus Xenobia bacterium]|jgi:8-oxo-dGTP diphosphatase
MGLVRAGGRVLVIDKIKGPEPGVWDLPGGGIEPAEPMLDCLRREVLEETGLESFDIVRQLGTWEQFFPGWRGQLLQSISVIYECLGVVGNLRPGDAQEVGPRGVQWIDPATLSEADCSRRLWAALREDFR